MIEEEILNNLNSLSEDAMIEEVILPVYKKKFKNCFYDIEFTGKDKKEDQGIDITYYEVSRDTIGKEYFGIQVKQGKINTSKGANGISSIAIQAQQAFTKKIPNIKEKGSYYITTYIILTTGEITSAARIKIVDDFKGKNIRFIDGKTLAGWIRNDFMQEFYVIFPQEEDEDETDEDESPLQSIVKYIEENFEEEIDEIQGSLNTVDSSKIKILKILMISGGMRKFEIAKKLGKSMNYIDFDIVELLQEDIIDGDENGFSINYDMFGDWKIVKRQTLERIEQLGYNDEIDIEDVIEAIF